MRGFQGMQRLGRQWTVGAVIRTVLLALCAMVAPVAGAQTVDEELPGRVGRIADFAGELYLSPQDRASDWSPVGQNYPVATGDNLWVSGDGRAEVDYGGGQFRLTGDANVHVSRLDDRQLALFVAQGRVIVRLRVLDRGDEAIVDTPNTQIRFTRPGLYRVEVDKDRVTTTVIVREGEALVAITGGAQQILPGQIGQLSGPEPAYASVTVGIGVDGFDAWSADRDRRYERGRSANYVSRQMVGSADLDEYGNWEGHPTYGAVWYPSSVVPGWAPYRYGRWAWVGNWGWTWVDDAPWGYAPFHYGRWVSYGGRWGWSPGAYVARPAWAPALVGWYGGDRWNVSVNFGAPVYGWVPLGWGDPYIPSWGRGGCGERCWTHYNRPYAVNRAERPHAAPVVYANSRIPGAITAVPGAAMSGRRPVAQNLVPVPPHAAGGLPVLATAPAVKPLRLPDARPGPGLPAPASSFHPTTKPRLVSPSPVGVAGERPASAGSRPGDPTPVVRPPPQAPVRVQSAPVSAGGAPVTARPAPAPARPPQAVPVPNAPVTSAPAARVEPRPVPGRPSSAAPVPPPVSDPGPRGAAPRQITPQTPRAVPAAPPAAVAPVAPVAPPRSPVPAVSGAGRGAVVEPQSAAPSPARSQGHGGDKAGRGIDAGGNAPR